MNSEIYSFLLEKLWNLKVKDIYITNINMKKNRPGNKISILCSENILESVEDILFLETTTYGIRYHRVKRSVLNRKLINLKTSFGLVNFKEGYYKDKLIKVTPEYEDCKKIANKYNMPIIKVYEELMEEYKKKSIE